MKRFFAFLLASVLLCGLLSGCAAKMSQEAYNTAAAPAAAEAPAPEPEEAAAMEAADLAYTEGEAAYDTGKGVANVGGQSAAQYGGHKIIRNFSLELRTDSFTEHYDRILERASAIGGYVQDSYVYGKEPEVYGDSGRHAQFTLRVPSDKVDGFISEASECGELISSNENTEDVTTRYFDLETRLNVKRTTLERLQAILERAETVEDIIALETEIASITVDIEELTTQRREYDNLIEYSTVNIFLQEESLKAGPAAKESVWERIGSGFTETLSGLGNFFENFFVVLVIISPVLAVIAVIAVAVVLIVRNGKKRKARKLMGNAGEGKNNEQNQ